MARESVGDQLRRLIKENKRVFVVWQTGSEDPMGYFRTWENANKYAQELSEVEGYEGEKLEAWFTEEMVL